MKAAHSQLRPIGLNLIAKGHYSAMKPNPLILGTVICGFLASVQVCLSQSTIFSYQGRLSANGSPANGLFDFRFAIYKAETNGLVIGGPLTITAVAVTNGLFTTSLDFGHQPFLSVNSWMDYAVRTNGSTNAFSTLTPRIRIASAPYAIAAANVIDGAVTASSLSPGPGADGQVLRMNSGVLAWGNLGTGGTVTSVATGVGLRGGPITASGTLSIDPTVVPSLWGDQTFGGANTLTNAANSFAGSGAGLIPGSSPRLGVNINLGSE